MTQKSTCPSKPTASQSDRNAVSRGAPAESPMRVWRALIPLFLLLFALPLTTPVTAQALISEQLSQAFTYAYSEQPPQEAQQTIAKQLPDGAPRSMDIIRDVVIKNISGEEVSTVVNNQAVVINILWDAAGITDMKEGDYLEVILPEELRFPTDDAHANFEIKDQDGVAAGKVVVTNAGNGNPGSIRLTFYKYVEGLSGLRGSLQLGARVYAEKTQQGNVSTISLLTDFNQSYSIDIVVEIIDFEKETIIKWPYRIEGEQNMKWRARINLSGKALGDVTVSDSIQNGVVTYVPDSFTLTRVEFDEFGDIKQAFEKIQLTQGDQLTFNAEMTAFTAKLGTFNHTSYVLDYETTFVHGTTIQNKITLDAKDYKDINLSDESAYNEDLNSGGDIQGNRNGFLQIVKIEEGKPEVKLAGAEFRVTNLADQSQRTLVTDANGETEKVELLAGAYRIDEIKVPAGYLANSPSFQVTVEVDKTVVSTVTNRKTPDIPPTGISSRGATDPAGVTELYQETNLSIEIPSLNITAPIVEVPLR